MAQPMLIHWRQMGRGSSSVREEGRNHTTLSTHRGVVGQDDDYASGSKSRPRKRRSGSFLVAVLCAALLWSTPASARKYTVCSLTITTDYEINEFREHLEPNDFEFVELTPADGRAFRLKPWFEDACRSGVQCDVLVISADFAGSYFKDGGLNLSSQELEERSCSDECAGILHHPLEVFLFACNALASKNPDSRTPDQYLEVLLEHGLDRAQAERVVAARYAELGSSFNETSRRVFAGVPHIYGFDSKAPSGRNVRPLVDAYLRSVGDYAAHLRRLEKDRADLKPQLQNSLMKRLFRQTAWREEAGVRTGEPGAEKKRLTCMLYDESRSIRERLEIVEEIMRGPDFLAFLPNIQTLLDRHPPDTLDETARETFDGLTTVVEAKEEILGLIARPRLPLLDLELARFAHQMSWIDLETFHDMARAGVADLLEGPTIGFEARDIICGIATMADLSGEFTAASIPARAYGDPNGIMAVDCLGLRGREIVERLLPALESPDAETRAWAIYALSRQPVEDPAHFDALARRLDDPEPDIRWLADQTIRYLQSLRERGKDSP